MIVPGFEPADLLYGIYKCIVQLEKSEAKLENAYKRAVPEAGNNEAKNLMETFLKPVERNWRGIGSFPASGFALRGKYSIFDAAIKFPTINPLPLNPLKGTFSSAPTLGGWGVMTEMNPVASQLPSLVGRGQGRGCIAGEIMKGNRQVSDCACFGTTCTPEHPVGASMVSEEGVCAAYYNYQTVM
jgi:hydrogenase expression/formation protein HypD